MSELDSTNTQFFSPEYTWLDQTFQQAKKSFDAGKLAHGLLLVAPYQSGKALFAKSLAKSIMCETSNSQLSHFKLSKACGHCKSCLLIDAKSHPDLSNVDCLVDNKGKQKKSIGIDQIRQLTNKLVETPQLNGWRIAIIMSVEKMTRGAFNAILKTLEEPGDKTLILMLANSLNQVPATIRSRCQRLNMKLMEKDLLPWLIKAAKCQQSVALEALNTCHYAPFAALNYIQQGLGEQYRQLSKDLDQVFQTFLSPQEFVALYSGLDEQLWIQIANYFQKTQVSILESKQTIYQKVPKTLVVQLYAQLLEYNRGQCAGSNLQSQLQLEAILIQWFEIGRKIVHYSNR